MQRVLLGKQASLKVEIKQKSFLCSQVAFFVENFKAVFSFHQKVGTVRNPDFPGKADSCSPAYDLLISAGRQAEVSYKPTLLFLC